MAEPAPRCGCARIAWGVARLRGARWRQPGLRLQVSGLRRSPPRRGSPMASQDPRPVLGAPARPRQGLLWWQRFQAVGPRSPSAGAAPGGLRPGCGVASRPRPEEGELCARFPPTPTPTPTPPRARPASACPATRTSGLLLSGRSSDFVTASVVRRAVGLGGGGGNNPFIFPGQGSNPGLEASAVTSAGSFSS